MRTFASAIVSALLVASCGKPASEGQAQGGKALFEETCARCHAADGKGDPTAKLQLGVPDMTDLGWQKAHPDDLIKRTVREGSQSKKMPPFGNLYSDAQLDAIIAHVRTLAR